MVQDQPSSQVGTFHGTPKTMFFLGLFAGLAGAAIIALIVLLSFLWAGKGVVSAQEASAPTPNQIVQQPSPSAPTPAGGPVKPVDEKTEPIRGKKDAKVTLIEYSDFECPFCLRHQATLDQILKAYPNDVR
jgi:protein-disulfide isomerase